MSLLDLYNTYSVLEKTDKGNGHDYINSFYNTEFTPLRDTKLTLVEIGIAQGLSMKLFGGWFTNARIFGIDISSKYIDDIDNVMLLYGDAYTDQIIEKFADDSIDYLIDDGPHTLQSQLDCVVKWFPKIKKGGTLIIEDIQNIDGYKPKFDELGIPYQIIDTRISSNKYDDVLLIFRK